jgi:hypothetical protein
MKIYDYTKYGQCFLAPSVDGRLDEIIGIINKGLPFSMPKAIHPKELERLARIKKREEERNPYEIAAQFTTPQQKKKESKQKMFEYKNGVMIVAGSCGFGTKPIEYFEKRFSELNEYLVSSNFHILFVRGNNDDPSYFDEEKINFSNIKTLASNCVVKLSQYSCLCIGGGISFDREWKKEKSKEYGTTMYWDNEGIDFDIKEIEDAIKENDIACVITHEIPSFVSPSTGGYRNNRWFKNDKTLLADTIKCRTKLDSVYNELVKADKKPYVWWHTHIDNSNKQTINDILFKSSQYIDSLNSIVHDHFGKYLTEDEKKINSYKSYWDESDLYWDTATTEVAEFNHPVEVQAIQPAIVGRGADAINANAAERMVQYNVQDVYNRIREIRENNENGIGAPVGADAAFNAAFMPAAPLFEVQDMAEAPMPEMDMVAGEAAAE